MKARVDYRQHGAGAYQAMLGLETYLAGCGLDHKFIHLLKLRASKVKTAAA